MQFQGGVVALLILHLPNQQRTLNKLPTEVRCRSTDWAYKSVQRCKNVHATFTCQLRFHFACRRWWLGSSFLPHTNSFLFFQNSHGRRLLDQNREKKKGEHLLQFRNLEVDLLKFCRKKGREFPDSKIFHTQTWCLAHLSGAGSNSFRARKDRKEGKSDVCGVLSDPSKHF